MAIFSLNEVKIEQANNVRDNNFASWPESGLYGYFGGGYVPPRTESIQRLDFSTDTLSNPSPSLSQARYNLASVSNSSYGYFAGGHYLLTPTNPIRFSTIDRLDFSNDTTSVPVGKLPGGRYALSAIESNSYGYFAGGIEVSPVNTIQRLDFSTETGSLPGIRLFETKRSLSSSKSSLYGYFAGGVVTFSVSTIDRLDFSNETMILPGNNLTQGRSGLTGASSSAYGYFGKDLTCSVDRLDFSSETVSLPGKNFSVASAFSAATSSNSYGYFAGGGTSLSLPYNPVSTIERLDFSSETASLPGNNLTLARYGLSATSGGSSVLRPNKTYGYFAGGLTPTSTSTINRFDFSTETKTALTSTLSAANSDSGATSSNSYGYFAGGSSGISSIDRLDFSNETRTTPPATLSTGKSGITATSSNSYGYFAGGSGTGAPNYASSIIDRLDFLTEVRTTSPATLSSERTNLAATSSSSYGYFGGGSSTNPFSSIGYYYSTINRLDFSTETRTTPTSSLNASGVENLGGTSNNSYAYFAGGHYAAEITFNNFQKIFYSTINRLDFSTETKTTPTNLSAGKGRISTTSSSSYGYFAGGDIGTPIFGFTAISTIDRLDFSTETRTSPTTLPTPNVDASGLSNSN